MNSLNFLLVKLNDSKENAEQIALAHASVVISATAE